MKMFHLLFSKIKSIQKERIWNIQNQDYSYPAENSAIAFGVVHWYYFLKNGAKKHTEFQHLDFKSGKNASIWQIVVTLILSVFSLNIEY